MGRGEALSDITLEIRTCIPKPTSGKPAASIECLPLHSRAETSSWKRVYAHLEAIDANEPHIRAQVWAPRSASVCLARVAQRAHTEAERCQLARKALRHEVG